MKLRSFLMGVLGVEVGAVAILGGRAIVGRKAPYMVVRDLDIGDYEPGRTIERALRVCNSGDELLVIERIDACCGIKLAGALPLEVPGRSADVVLLCIQTPSGFPSFKKTLTVISNDPRMTRATVRVRGVMRPYAVEVEPSRIELGRAQPGVTKRASCSVRAVAPLGESFSVVSSSPHVLASPVRSSDGKEATLEVTVGNGCPRGELREYLYITTGIPDRPAISIPINAEIERGVSARPSRVFFGAIHGRENVVRTVSIEVIDPSWEGFLVSPSTVPGVKVELRHKGPRYYELEVTVSPSEVREGIGSEIVLKSQTGDEMRLPMMGIVGQIKGHP